MNDDIILAIGCGIMFFVTAIGFAFIVLGVKNKGKTTNTPCPKCNHPTSIAQPGVAIAETDEFMPNSELVGGAMNSVIGGFLAFGGLVILLGSGIGIDYSGILTALIALISGAGMLISNINKILAYNSIKRRGTTAIIFTCAKCRYKWYQTGGAS